ncbi:unnamed protein product [Gongylonema pulchrum]|uniref:BESS domain-containing protein n=1 Tax=Gongylonema pulchrum TaxID=637853 RepID=A0A183DRI2_9BILA|nr:unnamed protein product [Gongylonema pulchrum]
MQNAAQDEEHAAAQNQETAQYLKVAKDREVEQGQGAAQAAEAEKRRKKKKGHRRGGTKRRLMSLVYYRQLMTRGQRPGGWPLHAPNSAEQPQVPVHYPALRRPGRFPPQKFGFFNETVPSVHPGHPGSEKRAAYGRLTHVAGINELFARMLCKKLEMIRSPSRLNRLHTDIMNLLQQALAEESKK